MLWNVLRTNVRPVYTILIWGIFFSGWRPYTHMCLSEYVFASSEAGTTSQEMKCI